MKTFISIFLSLICLNTFGQASSKSYTIKGKLITTSVSTLENIPINLLNATTNKLVKVEFADVKGNYLFEGVKEGNYLIEISHVSLDKAQSSKFDLKADVTLPDIILSQRENSIKEVSVQASKPAIQYQFGKVILNVANSISGAGSTALEVLEKAPGVLIDQNDNISVRGKQGVMVMIDGKRVPMSGAELANMLRSTSSDNIEKIEIVTNPSSKYDAQGNAGIIDIRLKKDTRLGTNGTLLGSFGQGEYSKIATGATFNTRKKNLNFFGSYNFNHRKDYIEIEFFRRFLNLGNVTGIFRQDNLMYNIFDVHNYRIGADYNISKSTIIGVIYNGLNSNVAKTSDNKSLAYDPQEVFLSSFLTNSDNVVKRNVHSVNLNLKHNFDNKGHELTADADYARFVMDDNQNYITRYFNQSNQSSQPNYILKGKLAGLLDVRSIKADYARPLTQTSLMEFGAKSSLVKSDNDVQFFDNSLGTNLLDTSKSNHFLYDEYIHAAYISARKSWKKFDMQLGLRLEHTNANGVQLKDNVSFERLYTQLFPNIYAGYKLAEKHQVSAALGRRINRPTYNQLNPFKIFLDTTTYVTGNPYLKPELTTALDFSYIYDNKYIVKFGLSHTSDNIITVLSPDPKLVNVIAQVNQNLASLDLVSLNVTIPVSIGKWLVSTNNFLAYYGKFSGYLANTNLNNGQFSFNVNSNNQFKLTNTLTAELIAAYNSSSMSGFLNIEPVYTFSAGIQKLILNKQANLKFNVSDALRTNILHGTTSLTGYKEVFTKATDSQVATFSISYRFGRSQVGPARRRATGAEEEKRRAGGS